jgi:PIN domain nuclease of toxin-antitoxin system
MRVLLDTHILLWALGQPEKLPRVARAMLEAGRFNRVGPAQEVE